MIPDISHWHPVRNWAQLKANCAFVISKATEGTNYTDPTLKSFIRGCEQYHIPYYLYVFLRKGNELAQTQYMERVCKPLVGKYFRGYCLDVESGNSPAGVQAALRYLEARYPRVILYTMYAQQGLYQGVINNRSVKTAHWQARYGLNNGVYNAKFPCSATADLHQFTSRGYQPGVGGSTDLSRLTGKKSLAWFIGASTPAKKTGAKPAAKPAPAPAKKTTKPSITAAAQDVLRGKYGNGQERIKRLKAKGYSPQEIRSIQAKVNDLLLDRAARDVIAGKYGNGLTRRYRLKKAGFDVKKVQAKVNRLLGKK